MKTYVNPLFEGADPFVLLDGDNYYLYCTSAPDGYKVYVSSDLTTWKDGGYCLRRDDVMGEGGFWAPEVLKRGGKYYMVYTADEHIGIAVADRPEGPFTQQNKAFLSQRNAIDGHFFVDDDGAIYLYYVRFEGGNVVYGAKLRPDMTLDEEGEVRLVSAELPWEKIDCLVAEGPFVLKRGGKYFLTYSANHTRNAAYCVGCAVSDSPLGKFVKYDLPVLCANDSVVGTGHHSFVTAKNGELAIVYHSHFSPAQFSPRMVCVDRAEFVADHDGKLRLVVHGPTHTPQKGF